MRFTLSVGIHQATHPEQSQYAVQKPTCNSSLPRKFTESQIQGLTKQAVHYATWHAHQLQIRLQTTCKLAVIPLVSFSSLKLLVLVLPLLGC